MLTSKPFAPAGVPRILAGARVVAVIALLAGAILLCGAGAVVAAPPTGAAAPAYPGNVLTLDRPSGPLVAGTVQRVHLSGHAVWNDEQTDSLTTPYTISLYVQNAEVDAQCSPSYGGQLEKAINLPGLNASLGVTGFAMSDSVSITPAPPANSIDWEIDSTPFSVKPGIDAIVLCAYQRYVTDDVAYYQLPIAPRQPTCRFAAASIRRSAKTRVTCNLRGRIAFRFRRSGTPTKTLTASADSKGAARLSTKRLARGTYRVTMSADGLELGTRRLKLR